MSTCEQIAGGSIVRFSCGQIRLVVCAYNLQHAENSYENGDLESRILGTRRNQVYRIADGSRLRKPARSQLGDVRRACATRRRECNTVRLTSSRTQSATNIVIAALRLSQRTQLNC